jgi:hypothetical protein
MSKRVSADVDIDVFGRDRVVEGLGCVFGRIDRGNGKYEKHNTGVYLQNIPRDPVTNISTIDHRTAKEYGYFKVDILNVNLYEDVRDEAHLLALLDKEPPWDFLEYEEVTEQLFHLTGYHHLLKQYKPQSVEDLAMILAIIRPAKAYLQNSPWEKVRSEVWVKNDSGDDAYQFKRGHAISYALAIIVNLNLLIEKLAD